MCYVYCGSTFCLCWYIFILYIIVKYCVSTGEILYYLGIGKSPIKWLKTQTCRVHDLLKMKIIAILNGFSVWNKVVFNSRINLNNVSTFSSHVKIMNSFSFKIWRSSSNCKGVRPKQRLFPLRYSQEKISDIYNVSWNLEQILWNVLFNITYLGRHVQTGWYLWRVEV